MYGLLLILHNLTRWLVLVSAVYALYTAFNGMFTRHAYSTADRRAQVIYGAVSGVQFILGLLLYVWPGGLVMGTLTNAGMAGAMRNSESRFFVAEHIVAMVLAVALIHIGSGVIRRAASDVGKFRRMAIFDGIATLLILLSIPWWRPLLRI